MSARRPRRARAASWAAVEHPESDLVADHLLVGERNSAFWYLTCAKQMIAGAPALVGPRRATSVMKARTALLRASAHLEAAIALGQSHRVPGWLPGELELAWRAIADLEAGTAP